jgi:hypothetical protein
MDKTRVTIAFDGTPTAEDSIALVELQESLDDAGVVAERTVAPSAAGSKDGGLTLGLAIAGLAVSAIGTLISAITLWGSKKNYSVAFKTGDATFSANSLSPKEALAVAAAIKDKAVAADIRILVSRR